MIFKNRFFLSINSIRFAAAMNNTTIMNIFNNSNIAYIDTLFKFDSMIKKEIVINHTFSHSLPLLLLVGSIPLLISILS